jgi:Protein of unknown function (DUF3455)
VFRIFGFQSAGPYIYTSWLCDATQTGESFMRYKMLGPLLAAVAIFAGPLCLQFAAQDIPQAIRAPEGEQVVLRVHAKGDQVYVCQSGVTRNAWRLREPDAQLFDPDGKLVGKHFAGPSWQVNDGSKVRGEAEANAPSPDKNSIPWLRLKVISHEGTGVLSPVTTVLRINTKGGATASETGCDEAHAGKELRVPYEADYVFYAPK